MNGFSFDETPSIVPFSHVLHDFDAWISDIDR